MANQEYCVILTVFTVFISNPGSNRQAISGPVQDRNGQRLTV